MHSNAELIDELVSDGSLSTDRLIAAFRAIDRADFVSEDLRDSAYLNTALPIGHGQTISQPYTVAFMLELLQPRYGDTVLDIGYGSGWQTALLSHVVSTPVSNRDTGEPGKVVALEVIPELCDMGKRNVAAYDFIATGVAHMRCMNAQEGFADFAPYDRIIAAASAPQIPPAWREQLADGGRIVAPRNGGIVRLDTYEGQWEEHTYPGFAFVPFV